MKHRMTTLLAMFGSVALLTSVMCAKPVALYVWNASESAPLGLYRLQPVDTLFVTELVAVLPPEPLAAFLAEGSYLSRGVPMLKRVLALPGQTVCRNGLTITVDGIGLGEARDRDRRGRPLPIWQGCRVVARDDVFLMNWQSSDSLDGQLLRTHPGLCNHRPRAADLDRWRELTVCCSRSQIAARLTHRVQPHSSFQARAGSAAASRGRRSRPLGQVASKSPRVGCRQIGGVVFNRVLSGLFARGSVRRREHDHTSHGRRDKSADCRRAFLVGRVGVTEHRVKSPAGAFAKMSEKTVAPEPSLIPSFWGRL